MKWFKLSVLVSGCDATKHEKCQGGGEYFCKAPQIKVFKLRMWLSNENFTPSVPEEIREKLNKPVDSFVDAENHIMRHVL